MWEYTFDAVGNRLTSTDPLDRTTEYTSDELDRLISETDPRGGVTEYGYDDDGNRTSVTDPLDNTTEFVYDQLHRVIEELDPLGNSRFSNTTPSAISRKAPTETAACEPSNTMRSTGGQRKNGGMASRSFARSRGRMILSVIF